MVVTNAPDAFDGILAEDSRTARGLWEVWERIAVRLDALPLWALETIELILRDLDERALARVIGHFAERVRKSGRGCGHWTDSFKPDARWGERRALPAHADCVPLDPDRVAAHLLPGGTFARLMPGYEPRPGQVEMTKAVARAFSEGRHLLVEAGTGVGKSLAYLIPAAAWALLNDVPVVVSTNTRNLQSQLVEKDIPLVLAALTGNLRSPISDCRFEETEPPNPKSKIENQKSEVPLRVALLKGRSNYFCLRRLAILLEQSQYELERPELRHFAEAVTWAVQTPDGDLDTCAGAGRADAAFLAKLSSTAEECPAARVATAAAASSRRRGRAPWPRTWWSRTTRWSSPRRACRGRPCRPTRRSCSTRRTTWRRPPRATSRPRSRRRGSASCCGG